MLISDEQLVKTFDTLDDAMVIIRQHIKDDAVLSTIRKKLLLAIVTLVPDAGAMSGKKS